MPPLANAGIKPCEHPKGLGPEYEVLLNLRGAEIDQRRDLTTMSYEGIPLSSIRERIEKTRPFFTARSDLRSDLRPELMARHSIMAITAYHFIISEGRPRQAQFRISLMDHIGAALPSLSGATFLTRVSAAYT